MRGHLTVVERDRIARMLSEGFQQQEIAAALDRSPSTITRELARNGQSGDYHAAQAQERARQRRAERPLVRRMDNPELNELVRHGLSQQWSPDQIAERLKLESAPQRVSAQSIYNWIRRDPDKAHWQSFLRRRGRRPWKRKKPASPGAPIKDRPVVIEERSRLGDFEGDTVLGPPGTGGIATLVCRKSRFTITTKISSKEADHVHARIQKRLAELDREHRQSLTFDNGTEFAFCARLEKQFDVKLYFAEPGRPYQRGTNENTNGLIRQFYPKGTNFQDVSHAELREAENLLNDRPRACLGYRTPREVFSENQPSTNCD